MILMGLVSGIISGLRKRSTSDWRLSAANASGLITMASLVVSFTAGAPLSVNLTFNEVELLEQTQCTYPNSTEPHSQIETTKIGFSPGSLL